MPTGADENIMSAAQDSYFKGDFQAALDRLTAVLDAEEVSK
jgi:hypothetical protein